jgi:hypothetical protein
MTPSRNAIRDVADIVLPDDVLLRDPHLPFTVFTTVLGLPMQLRSNSRDVRDMFTDAFGTSTHTADAESDALHVTVVVHRSAVESTAPRHVRHICPDASRVLMHCADGMAISDPLRREALVYASEALARDATLFRHEMLEAAVLALVTHFDRQPFHAAAIVHNDRTVLLVGRSGAGKSTLAYLAQTTGITVLSEDTVWIQLEPRLRLWSRLRGIHLLPDATAHFPELHDAQVMRRPNEKLKATVPVTQADASSADGDSVRVCLLEPGGSAAQLTPLDAEAMRAALTRDVDSGFDRYVERRAECVRVLTERGGYRLTLSSNPRDALPLFRELLGAERLA